MNTSVKKSPHYNNFTYTGDKLVNGDPADTMIYHGWEAADVECEDKETTGKQVAYHYSDISSSLFLYKDGSYGITSG